MPAGSPEQQETPRRREGRLQPRSSPFAAALGATAMVVALWGMLLGGSLRPGAGGAVRGLETRSSPVAVEVAAGDHADTDDADAGPPAEDRGEVDTTPGLGWSRLTIPHSAVAVPTSGVASTAPSSSAVRPPSTTTMPSGGSSTAPAPDSTTTLPPAPAPTSTTVVEPSRGGPDCSRPPGKPLPPPCR